MQIIARQTLNDEHIYEVKVHGAPIGALTEFRFYDSMSGKSLISVAENGTAEYFKFGQHVAIRVRFLNTANEASALHSFVFSPEASDPPKRFAYVSPEDKSNVEPATSAPETPHVAPEAQES
jgi:hypothetical protein